MPGGKNAANPTVDGSLVALQIRVKPGFPARPADFTEPIRFSRWRHVGAAEWRTEVEQAGRLDMERPAAAAAWNMDAPPHHEWPVRNSGTLQRPSPTVAMEAPTGPFAGGTKAPVEVDNRRPAPAADREPHLPRLHPTPDNEVHRFGSP